ncbi:MAG: inositol monophosphatase family protein [Gemmatimonadota bacterium]
MSAAADSNDLLETARRAADAAAKVHHEGLGRIGPAGWNEKARSDFVTEVDVEAERQIVEIIRGAYPEHDVMAEEGTDNSSDGAGGIRWVIDPLDGTTNWLHGYPEYAVSLAAEDEHGAVVALVLNSATGERFEAIRGGGAFLDESPIRVSTVSDLSHALVGTGFPFKKLEVLPEYLATFERVLRNTSGIRRAGAAALDLCDVACGRLDAFFEYWLMPWDVAAGALIVQEAGGQFERLEVPGLMPYGAPDVDCATEPVGRLDRGGFLAANAELFAPFRALVRTSVNPGEM